MKKKITAVLMAMAIILTMGACSKKETTKKKKSTKKPKKTESVEDTDETDEPTEDTTTEETTTEETTTEPQGPTKDLSVYGGATGYDACLIDMNRRGFEINPETIMQRNGWVNNDFGVSIENTDGTEWFWYYEISDDASMQIIDQYELVLQKPDYQETIQLGDVKVKFANDPTVGSGSYQFMVLNMTTRQVFYSFSRIENWAQCSAYCIELGILGEGVIVGDFEPDANYLPGYGLTVGYTDPSNPAPQPTTPAAPATGDLKNDKANALLSDMVADGCDPAMLPNDSFSTDLDGVGFMTYAGNDKYKDILMFTYLESDPTEVKMMGDQLKSLADMGDYECKQDGNVFMLRDSAGSMIYVCDADNGYYIEYMGFSKECGDMLIAALGYSF